MAPRPPVITRAPKRQRLKDRDDTVTTSLVLPRALHEEAHVAAVRLNWSLGEVMRVALGDWLRTHRLPSGG